MAAAAVFALTPAVAIQGVIDYSTSEGRKIYTTATYKLDEELYDCTPEDLHQFLQSVQLRAKEFGWDDEVTGILQIPDDPLNIMAETQDFILNYGQVSLEEIKAFDQTYLHLQVRPAQDSSQLFKCLMNSISKEGKVKINLWKDQYTVKINGVGYYSGTMLLKVIVRESHLDTNATTATIRTKLSSLDSYITTVNCDISKFNQYVILLVDSLAARGETAQDLLSNLFKGYLAASDKTFTSYIARKLEHYEEGTLTEPKALMQQAANKFKLLKESGKYNAPSEEEEKILALQAEIKTLSKKVTKGGKSVTMAPGTKGNPKTGKGKGKSKKDFKEKPDWFTKKPKAEDLHKPKIWNDKSWYYCSADTGGKCDGQYRRHKPAECEGKAHKYTKADKTENKRAGSNKESRKLKLTKAMSTVATLQQQEEESSDESEDSQE